MNKKTKLILLSFLLLLIFGAVIYFYVSKNKQQDAVKNTQNQSAPLDTDTDKDNSSDVEKVDHNLTLSIIKPEGERFDSGQARMYEALAEGNGKYSNNVKCHWEFFLNQNNEETLYQTMDTKSILSGESKKICGFTSTFIESRGVLRVRVIVTVYNATNPNLETVSAERMYTVI